MAISEPFSEARAAQVIALHAEGEGTLLPMLHALQEVFGHIPRAAVPMVAQVLNLSRAEVHGVISFYHDFRHTPAGRTVVKLCQAEACQAMGCRSLAAAAEAALGVRLGETTADGRITLEPVYCLGLCATAPSGMIAGRPVGRLTPARLAALLAAAQ
ncbi:MAG: formate dehydrogenase subunit gamma [Alphaproteobacteria bacterium]|nr:formate dehydrogenase subunit gamma [Alphaproteobacteria bacterium]